MEEVHAAHGEFFGIFILVFDQIFQCIDIKERRDWYETAAFAENHDRFAAAGAAIRYQAVHSEEVEDILALDIALRRNDTEWFEHLPPEIDSKLVHKLYYGHFMCYVFHQDYIVKKGVDAHELKEQMLALLRERGAQYPAEHNVGHLYKAPDALKQFYRENDPTNSMNPGIGKTTRKKYWKESADAERHITQTSD